MLQVMPFLAPFVGPGRLFNFLIRNRWCNDEAIAKLGQLPVCLLSSLQVCCLRNPTLHAALTNKASQGCPAPYASWHTCCQVFYMPQHSMVPGRLRIYPQFVGENHRPV